jgi:hypothetical protein
MSQHPISALRAIMKADFTEGLPPNVRPVPEWVADPQFFPGATVC